MKNIKNYTERSTHKSKKQCVEKYIIIFLYFYKKGKA